MGPAITAVITRQWPETNVLEGLLLEVPEEIALLHRRPGQYIRVHPEQGEPLHLAIASTPGDPSPLEILLGAEARARIAPLLGKVVVLDPPEGPGFPIERAEGRDVLVFSVGSGIAAVRPLLGVISRVRDRYQRVVYYAGAKRWEEQAYRRLDEMWLASGIEVRRSVGRPWVQEIFEMAPLPLEDAMVFVVGMPSMVDGVREVLKKHGLPDGRIAFNW
ncbi:MAG: hypothetical protein IT384_13085 [Deltaproteobacteria bacterium]|nr:hypothetical protein [Deltaproteobacteria bacterium]